MSAFGKECHKYHKKNYTAKYCCIMNKTAVGATKATQDNNDNYNEGIFSRLTSKENRDNPESICWEEVKLIKYAITV